MYQPPTYDTLEQLPARYTYTTKQMAAALNCKTSRVARLVDRLHHPIPHARVKRGMLITHYFDGLEVAAWLTRDCGTNKGSTS